MGRHRGLITEESIARRIASWDGEWRGSAYLPWLTIQNTPSFSNRYRIFSFKTGRLHHLLSNWEYFCFLFFEFMRSVIDIREQYALLPVSETMEIAKSLGIRYPIYRYTRIPVVMTSDFVLTTLIDRVERLVVRSIKPIERLTPRSVELLEVERVYWARRNVDWGLVTDGEIDRSLIDNLIFIRGGLEPERLTALEGVDLNKLNERLDLTLHELTLPISAYALSVDARWGYDPGTSIAAIKAKLASYRWKVMMTKPHLSWWTTDITILGRPERN